MSFARHVILFVIDGLCSDALHHASTPHIDGLIAQGAYTWQAQSVIPSISLPCYASLFLSVPPAHHGVLSNEWKPPQPAIPSLIEVVHQAGLGTAAFYEWEELRDLSRPGALDLAYYYRPEDPEGDGDLQIGKMVATYITRHRPAFTFVHLDGTDLMGHRHGWMSQPYLQAVSKADGAIGLVLAALRTSGRMAETACVVLSDHGGHDFDHNAGVAEDVTIPWIISGPGIRPGYQLTDYVNIIDTAPTIAYLLGLSPPAGWLGRVIDEIRGDDEPGHHLGRG